VVDFMAKVEYALSIKQPWATLLVHGLKSIEVRRWATARRGRILIHAARIPDDRPEAWELVPKGLREAAQRVGGIIGAGELIDCLTYETLEAFVKDQECHRNAPSWFQKPVLYGLVFANAAPTPFCSCSGWMRFFPVNRVK
jgi:hypothetical protein